MLPYSYNRWVQRVPWGRTTLSTWSRNLHSGWVWDNDHFAINQFAHPYSGNLYFNSARANGYDFWSSAPFALAGSILWEYFGETTRPSINDLLNTTIGGITLGETAYRLANLVIDRRAHGTTRLVREVGAALVDPPLALARLTSGDIARDEENPNDRRPSKLTSDVQLGYQRVNPGSAQSPLAQPSQSFAYYRLDYGDPLNGDVTHPFGAFRVEGTLATGTSGSISELRAIGFLGTHDFRSDESRTQELQVALHYHYLNTSAVLSGGQGLSGLYIARYPFSRSFSVRTELSALGYFIDGVKSDYRPKAIAVANETARNYDYGMGGGGRVAAFVERNGRDLFEGTYQTVWIGVLSGAARQHIFDVLGGRLTIPIVGRFGVGASAVLYRRASEYPTHATIHAGDARTQVFLSIRP